MTATKKNKFDFDSDESRQKFLNEIIAFFDSERDEKIGIIAAEQILDFFVENLGDQIYKKAIGETKSLLKEKMDELEVDLDLLAPKN